MMSDKQKQIIENALVEIAQMICSLIKADHSWAASPLYSVAQDLSSIVDYDFDIILIGWAKMFPLTDFDIEEWILDISPKITH